jgi:MFS family permease
MGRDSREPIWTRTYLLLCLSVGMVYVQYSLLMPALPLYVTDRGGSATVAGLVLLSFSVPSFGVRPLVGYWADAWSAAGVLAVGALLLGVGSLAYLLPVTGVLFIASVLRGFGWAGLNTGGYTVLADVAPPGRRGEASGYYTTIQGTVGIVFPALALWLVAAPAAGFGVVFVLAGLFALVGAAIGWWLMRQTAAAVAQTRTPLARGAGRRTASSMLDRGVLLATVLQLCATLAFPAVASFLPLYARELGIHNIGVYYIVAGAAGLLSRPFLGRASDRVGRGPSVAAGFATQTAGFALLVAAQDLTVILAGGVLIAIGFAMINATTIALAMDLADPLRRGTAMATYSMAFQMGNGFGSLLAGWLADTVGYRGMYIGACGIVAGGLLLSVAMWPAITRAGSALGGAAARSEA